MPMLVTFTLGSGGAADAEGSGAADAEDDAAAAADAGADAPADGAGSAADPLGSIGRGVAAPDELPRGEAP
jgi:hypothetical protein